MKHRLVYVVLFAAMLMVGCGTTEERIVLFDGQNIIDWNSVVNAENEAEQQVRVFGVRQGNIYVEGKPFGYLYTNESFDNYRLHIEWRWVGEGSNSGIFLHVQNPDIMWPEAIECQLCAGKAGDMVMLGGSQIMDIECKGEFPVKERFGDFEREVGEWNSAEIECDARQIRIYINGQKANECVAIKSKGHIALQSEGGPIEFRNIYLTKL